MQGKLVRQGWDIWFPGQRKADITEVSAMMKMSSKGIRKDSRATAETTVSSPHRPIWSILPQSWPVLFVLETTLNWTKLIGPTVDKWPQRKQVTAALSWSLSLIFLLIIWGVWHLNWLRKYWWLASWGPVESEWLVLLFSSSTRKARDKQHDDQGW